MSHVTIKLLDDIGRQVFFVGQHCNLGYFNSLGIFYTTGGPQMVQILRTQGIVLLRKLY